MKATRFGIYTGLVLILLGLLLPFVGVQIPSLLAVVVYDTTPPTLTNPNPSGTSTTPSIIPTGNIYRVSIVVTELESGIDYVKCYITPVSGTTYSITLTLWRGTALPGGSYEYYYDWSFSGIAEGAKLSFKFEAIDKAGNTASVITYAIYGGIPDGYFEINGQKVDQTSTIYVKTATLNFRFVATKSGAGITKVEVQVKQGATIWAYFELSETTPDTYWTGSYNLPSQGVFDVQGWFYVSTDKYQKMSLLMDHSFIPVPIPSLQELFNVLTIPGVAITTIFYAIEKVKEEDEQSGP